MKPEDAVIELQKMVDSAKNILDYFRPEQDTLKRVRWDVQNYKGILDKLKIEENAALSLIEQSKRDAEAIIQKAQAEVSKINELSYAELRNARAAKEEAIRRLDEVKEFCNKFELQRASELKKKVAA